MRVEQHRGEAADKRRRHESPEARENHEVWCELGNPIAESSAPRVTITTWLKGLNEGGDAKAPRVV
jgi:hypothetical protein